MEIIIIILIVIGALNMINNIARYYSFLKSSQDVLSSGKKSDIFWMHLALILLVFFMLGYLIVGFFSVPDMMVALLLDIFMKIPKEDLEKCIPEKTDF